MKIKKNEAPNPINVKIPYTQGMGLKKTINEIQTEKSNESIYSFPHSFHLIHWSIC